MKILRMVAGISLFCSTVWLSPMVSEIFGFSQIFGFVTVGGLMAFVAGAIFWSGVESN